MGLTLKKGYIISEEVFYNRGTTKSTTNRTSGTRSTKESSPNRVLANRVIGVSSYLLDVIGTAIVPGESISFDDNDEHFMSLSVRDGPVLSLVECKKTNCATCYKCKTSKPVYHTCPVGHRHQRCEQCYARKTRNHSLGRQPGFVRPCFWCHDDSVSMHGVSIDSSSPHFKENFLVFYHTKPGIYQTLSRFLVGNSRMAISTPMLFCGFRCGTSRFQRNTQSSHEKGDDTTVVSTTHIQSSTGASTNTGQQQQQQQERGSLVRPAEETPRRQRNPKRRKGRKSRSAKARLQESSSSESSESDTDADLDEDTDDSSTTTTSVCHCYFISFYSHRSHITRAGTAR